MATMQQLIDAANAANANARQAQQQVSNLGAKYSQLEQYYLQQQKDFQGLQQALSRVQVQTRVGDPNIQRIENIPGKRVPFSFTVDIAIPADSTATQQGTITIDQSGPFVAVGRMATFLSTYQFQVQQPDTTTIARFNGRSFGRYRPVHSVFDVNDGQPFSNVTYAQAFPGTGAPHIASPSNASPWRSMEMDFRIKVTEQGSSMPRSNLPEPSAFWMEAMNTPWKYGALDFFERNEVITIDVAPLHQPNPAFGNISGFGVPADFPFINSQWDAVEGINDQAQTITPGVDPVTRVASGVLTIGFWGYRIWQPPGAGQF